MSHAENGIVIMEKILRSYENDKESGHSFVDVCLK